MLQLKRDSFSTSKKKFEYIDIRDSIIDVYIAFIFAIVACILLVYFDYIPFWSLFIAFGIHLIILICALVFNFKAKSMDVDVKNTKM